MGRPRNVPAASPPLRRLLPAMDPSPSPSSSLIQLLETPLVTQTPPLSDSSLVPVVEPSEVTPPASSAASTVLLPTTTASKALFAGRMRVRSRRKPSRYRVVTQVYVAANTAKRIVPNQDDLLAAAGQLDCTVSIVEKLWGQRCHPEVKPGMQKLDIGLLAAIFREQTGGLSMREQPDPKAATKRKRAQAKPKKPRKMTSKVIAALLTKGLAEFKETAQEGLVTKDADITMLRRQILELKTGMKSLSKPEMKLQNRTKRAAETKLAEMMKRRDWDQEKLEKLLKMKNAITINAVTYRANYHSDLKQELALLDREISHDVGILTEAQELVERCIGEATRSITVIFFSFTKLALAEALVAAKRRGVAIYVLACRSNLCASDRSVQTFNHLIENDIPVYIAEGPCDLTAHSKIWLFDRRLTIETSLNPGDRSLGVGPTDHDSSVEFRLPSSIESLRWVPDDRRRALGLTFAIQNIPARLQQDRLERSGGFGSSADHGYDGGDDEGDGYDGGDEGATEGGEGVDAATAFRALELYLLEQIKACTTLAQVKTCAMRAVVNCIIDDKAASEKFPADLEDLE